MFKKNKPSSSASPTLDIYSGMRVEVSGVDGRMLFVAKLMNMRGDTAELHQYSEAASMWKKEAARPARIRGYNDYERKAVYMEAMITPLPKHIWVVEEIRIVGVSNDRAFFRLETDLDAVAVAFAGIRAEERPCKLRDISVGGARIASEYPYQVDDKFLLKVRLMEDREISTMYCQVLRIIEKEDSPTEYGCRFLELNDADQERITQNIFDIQRKQRSGKG